MAHDNMPGINVDLKDGGLVLPPPVLEGDTVLVIGTAEDGPVGVPQQVLRLSDALEIYGDFKKGTLLKGVAEAIGGGAKNVYTMRVGKATLATTSLTYSVTPIAMTTDSGPSLRLRAKNPGAKYNEVILTVNDEEIPRFLKVETPDGNLATFNIDQRDQEIDIRDLVAAINSDAALASWVEAAYDLLTEQANDFGDGARTSFFMTLAYDPTTGNQKSTQGTEVMELASVKELKRVSQVIPQGTVSTFSLLYTPDMAYPVSFVKTSDATPVALARVTDLTLLVDGTYYIYPETNVIRFGAPLLDDLTITHMFMDEYVVGSEAVLVLDETGKSLNGRVEFPFPDRVPVESPLVSSKTVVIPDPSGDFVSSMDAVISTDSALYPIKIDGDVVDPMVIGSFDAQGRLTIPAANLNNGNHVIEYFYQDGMGNPVAQLDTYVENGAVSFTTAEAHVILSTLQIDGIGHLAFPGLATADAEGVVTLDLTKLPNGSHTVTYDVTMPNLYFEYKRLPKLPTAPLSGGSAIQTKRLSGGSDGIAMSATQKYLDLAQHYLMLEHAAGIDHIILTHVYQDEAVTVQLPTGVIEPRNFAQQLAQLCHLVSTHDRFVFGYINTLPIQDTSLPGVAMHVEKLATNAKQLAGYHDETERIPARRADIGRYLNVCGNEVIFQSGLDNSLYANGAAAAYAGLVTALPVASSPTNNVLPGAVGPRYIMNGTQLSKLIGARYVSFKRNAKKQTVCADAMTAAVKGDYVRLSTARAVRAAVEAIRAAADPFIGKNASDLHMKNSLNAKIEGVLDTLRDQDRAFRGYEWRLFATPAQELLGEASGDLVIFPNHELRRFSVSVSLRPFQG